MTATAGSFIAPVATGDLNAFASLYTEYSARVFGLICRVVRDPAQAEEVAQETFVQVWRQAARFDPTKGSEIGWIMTMAHRRAVDRVRAAQASRNRDAAHHAGNFLRDFDPVSEECDTNGETDMLRACLSSLTTLQRESIVLAYFGGFTQVEISVLLSMPLGTIKSRIRDGLNRLRTEMVVA